MSEPGQSESGQNDLPSGFQPIARGFLARPLEALQAARGGPVAVRFGKVDGPPTVTTWTFDRERHGETVCIAFHAPEQMVQFAARWRALADAIHESGREDPSFRFDGANIDLGDGVWKEGPSDVCAFARRPGSQVQLIPNIYLLRDRGRLPAALAWERKTDTLYFRGTSTGSRVYEENSRVVLCQVAKTIPRSDCRISRMKQVDESFAARLSRDGLIGWRHPAWWLNWHRFLADVDGNVSSWDRYLLIGLFGGVPIRFETSWEECWHDLLVDGENCVVADRHTLAAVVQRLRARPDEARRIADNAKSLVQSRLSETALRLRLRQTLAQAGQRGFCPRP